jgi:hypothetical protein
MADLESLGIARMPIPLNESRVEPMLENLNPDWVLFDRFMMEEQFGWRIAQVCPGALRILDTIDLHSLRHARHRAHQAGREVLEEDLLTDLALRELASIFRSDLSLIVSSEEVDLLTGYYQLPPELAVLCPLMTALPDPGSWKEFGSRKHFMHIGNFKHPPNWDSVEWLHREIWPAIRRVLPDAELHLYGSYEPPKARDLQNPGAGFLMMGRADDALETMSRYRVCLAPLRFGAGQKGKLLDAMLTGTPSVTTAIGIEGMLGSGTWPGEVGESVEDLVQRAVRLYREPDTWEQAQSRAFLLLKEQFDESQLGPALVQRLELHSGDLESHRQRNFIGAMLRHHTLRSTEYMARWIEAKNKKGYPQ